MTVSVVQMFPPTVLTTSPATLYSLMEGGPTALLQRGRIRFANTSAGTVVVTAYVVPLDDTPGDGNDFCPGLAVAPHTNLDVDVPVLNLGMSIQAKADTATAITASSLDGLLVI